ncbi:hypothetical protein C0993_011114 [Termitomyces sp. T159_Od127]|nr:hypothetical protein C0993_011114 [Termitomyces sp. T159_Od127]
MRREELDQSSPSYDHQLNEVVDRLFEASYVTVKDMKVELIQNPDLASFEKKVVAQYRGEEFYNIHNHILRILNKAIISQKQAELELDHRRNHEEGVWPP